MKDIKDIEKCLNLLEKSIMPTAIQRYEERLRIATAVVLMVWASVLAYFAFL